MANQRSTFLPCSFLLLIILLLLIFSPQGYAESHQRGIQQQLHFVHKDVVGTRKLLQEEGAHLDYDDAGANPRHDPRRGRGGGATRNL